MMRSKSYFKKRILKFQKFISSKKLDGFILENPTDLAYFTGLKLSRGRLLISQTSAFLFVDGRYFTKAKKESPYPVKKLGEKELENVLKSWKTATVFGFDTALCVAAYKTLKSSFSQNEKKLKGLDQPTFAIRAVKDDKELAYLKESAALLWKGFSYLRKKLRVGISEIELAREFEFYVKKKGAEALSFPPIMAFGENSALPHHHSGSRKLKKNEMVLIDVGVVLNGYASDMTRVIFFGTVSKKIEELFHVVKKAHRAALEQCRPGISIASLDKIARSAMGSKEKYFVHALGHGIGLDVHEYPRISSDLLHRKLEQGMVITIEPGLYLPEVGGIRYEDMIVITKTGCQNLFKETQPH
ncbi:MAG: Xaa-Pro peptidase family protein [Simkaniaceae bacterium]|nr:Xaa-Pro peptidase family protein [Simkaniaceae bacterium]